MQESTLPPPPLLPSQLIPLKAQNEITYTLVDCVLQIQDNVMTTMKATLSQQNLPQGLVRYVKVHTDN